MPNLTWVEINLAAIQNNLRRMQTLTDTRAGTPFRVMAVVKANAYGHGAVEVAQAAAVAGADWMGVARAFEGLTLREAGVVLPTLVLGFTPPEGTRAALGADLTLTVFDFATAQAYAAIAHALNRRAKVHVKIDTGMGRLGIMPSEAIEFVKALRALDGLEVEGVFTHFAGSDVKLSLTPGPSPAGRGGEALKQLATFEEVLRALNENNLRPPLVHAANSAAAFALPASRFDLVRMGIALYGLNPSADVPCPAGFTPALTWKATIAQVKTLPPGHGVSYGAEYVTQETETLAVIPVGYADGYRRVPASRNVNAVLIHGQRAPVRGRVCMDQIIAGVSHIPAAKQGDEVILVGPGMTADEVAQRWGTINYDVTSGIMARVERVYG